MNSLFDSSAQILGWALLHFVWQGAGIALLLAFALYLLRAASANARYASACAALVLMFLMPVATVYLLARASFVSGANANAYAATETTGAGRRARMRLFDEEQRQGTSAAATRDETGTAGASFALSERLQSDVRRLLPYAVAVWIAGVIFLFIRLLGGWLVAERIKRRAGNDLSGSLREMSKRLCVQLQISRFVRVCESALVEVPTVIGWLRPVVLLPATALTGLTAEQLRALIAHELAHVRRHDYLVNLIQSAVEILLFYHPAVWWASGIVRKEREHACDDMAVAACGGDAIIYARALARVEETRHDTRGLAMAATGSNSGGSLAARIRRLVVAPQPKRTNRSAVAGLFVIGMLLCIFGGMSFLAASGNLYSLSFAQQSPQNERSGRRVAVTFVSLPPLQYGGVDFSESERITRQLIERLTEHRIPATGFVGENRVQVAGQEERRANLLSEWLDAGLDLGNQSFSHPKLYNTPVDEFLANMMRGERVTRRLVEARGRELRYFSYPGLNTGRSTNDRERVEAAMRERGYDVHRVTIDNDDWIYSAAYGDAKARGDEALMRSLRAEYVPYMERMFEFFEQMSRDVTGGREIPQVLMLSASALNADCFDDLVAMMRRRGYSFVTLEEAMRDEFFRQPDNYVSPYGYSWLQHRLAQQTGEERLEPETPFIVAYERELRARTQARGLSRRQSQRARASRSPSP
jgi:beta-lactamase regulating signal transducer with metallopeptidase domain/peptidoglycan/xylan/chitin deacetylase (PgdA/CDA1 family)